MPEVKATYRYLRTSAFKVREVLDLVRGLPVDEARQVLRFHERGTARDVLKVLESAVANAEHNNHLPADELFVSACFADEGMTLKRWRPRARGRATRIRKRTSHVTVVVDRMSTDQLERVQERAERTTASRAARVAGSRRAESKKSKKDVDEEITAVEEELAEKDAELSAPAGEAADAAEPSPEDSASPEAEAEKGGDEGEESGPGAAGDSEDDSTPEAAADGPSADESAEGVSPEAAEGGAEDEEASGDAGQEPAASETEKEEDK
ncbi:MAG: 50S ribosomal protein L22 [Actinobacteria bacterium]|nr:50S ribosomal protein L22 [Actinomycetota bacterium]